MSRKPGALSQAILRQRPELAGQVHYVEGRPWCDGVNHTTMCRPNCLPGYSHYFIAESDGVTVCQVCGQEGR